MNDCKQMNTATFPKTLFVKLNSGSCSAFVVFISYNRLLSSTGKGSGLVFVVVVCQDFECQQEILVLSR